jgi:hypothetical protein
MPPRVPEVAARGKGRYNETMRCILLGLLVGTVGIQAAGLEPLRIAVLGDRRGEVQPCGCPRVQLGGLQRLVAFLDARKKSAFALTVDTGNTFFSLPELPETRRPAERSKAELIADGYRLIGVDVLVPGPRDLALGLESLEALAQRTGTQLVASNWMNEQGQPLFAPYAIVTKKGRKLGVVGAVDGALQAPTGLIGPPLEPLRAAILKLRQAGVDGVVLVAQDRTNLEALRELAVDVVVVPPLEEGKGLSVVTWDPATKRTELSEHDLDPAWQKPGRLDARFKKYLADVRSLAVDKSSVFTPKDKGAFISQAGVCKQCHEKQYNFWESTKHASAYLVLYAKNQHFNPECIGCHSLGYLDKAGFSDITAPIKLVGSKPREKGETPFVENFMKEVFSADPGSGNLDSRTQPERYAVLKKRFHEQIHEWQRDAKIESLSMGVQCEHCHGNRNGHPGPGFKKVGKVKAGSCTQCHTPPHDDKFDFAKRIKQVACPRK